MLKIVEDSSPTYPPRTKHNAKTADFTLAFAVDFNTHGEKLTRNAAGEKKYLAIHLSEEPIEAARRVYRAFRATQARVINIAGNSIKTLAERGWNQSRIDDYIYQVISKVHEHHTLERILNGGQTGGDLAGAITGVALNIETITTMPKGYLQRYEDNIDKKFSEPEIRQQIEKGARALLERHQKPKRRPAP